MCVYCVRSNGKYKAKLRAGNRELNFGTHQTAIEATEAIKSLHNLTAEHRVVRMGKEKSSCYKTVKLEGECNVGGLRG